MNDDTSYKPEQDISIEHQGNSNTRDLYTEIKTMAIAFQFPPGERINEVHLAKKFGVSRTPLRGVLQQLVSEKLLRWERNKGFSCRVLNEEEIFELYEYRQILEEQSTRLACLKAEKSDFLELKAFVEKHLFADEDNNLDHLMDIDQEFHERIAELSGNNELLDSLQKVNQRIYFIRWIDMSGRRPTTQSEHLSIVEALIKGDMETAVSIMSHHVNRRRNQISGFIREGYGLIYTGHTPTPHS